MLKVFIGWDDMEALAAHVLAHSIRARSSIPVSFTFLDRRNLEGIFDRPRGEFESTDFSISRFIVPYLCNYEDYAVFMDCDMLCQWDVADFARYMTLKSRWTQAVQVVKHKYEPTEETKFLGNAQTKYDRKNWSSLMIFNNALCHALTPEYVNKAPGLELHQFRWCADDKIGGIPADWNYLVGEANQADTPPKLIHWTQGGPWFEQYKDAPYSHEWHDECQGMLYR